MLDWGGGIHGSQYYAGKLLGQVQRPTDNCESSMSSEAEYGAI